MEALAEVVSRHDRWTEGKCFLVVPNHLIGSPNLETAVLGQYAEHVRRLHPEAPTPGFYRAELLFEDAKRLREAMGDDRFFAKLGTPADSGAGWARSMRRGTRTASRPRSIRLLDRRSAIASWAIWSTRSSSRTATSRPAVKRDSSRWTMLTREGDRAMFRQVYPFSPALVNTLIVVSSLLQRERTALKLLMQLLVDQRETLELGDLVPVGDLYDVIESGDEPFTQAMKLRFEQAKRLYRQKLRPLLEEQHHVTIEDIEAGVQRRRRRARFGGLRLPPAVGACTRTCSPHRIGSIACSWCGQSDDDEVLDLVGKQRTTASL